MTSCVASREDISATSATITRWHRRPSSQDALARGSAARPLAEPCALFLRWRRLMRRILVDHATRAAAKRGAGRTVVLDGVDIETAPLNIDVLALDAALDKLAAVDERQSKLVELRFSPG